MKKTLFLLITVLAVVFSSCKKDDKEQNTHIGTWQVTKITEAPKDLEPFIDYDYTNNQYIIIAEINTDGSIRYGSVYGNIICLSTLNYKVENNEFTFTNGDFLDRINSNAKLEFKDNNKKIVITGTDTNERTHTIELMKTNEKIDNYTIEKCEK